MSSDAQPHIHALTKHASDKLSEAATQLLRAAHQYDGTPPVSDQALLSAAQGGRELFEFHLPSHEDHSSPVTGTAATRAHSLIALAILGEGELDLVVHPAHRGRGIGSQVLNACLAHHATTTRGTGASLKAWAHGENPAAHALLREAGFRPSRELLRMALDPEALPAAITAARAWPKAFELRSFDPERADDAAAWVQVNATAFAAHPEQGRITLADFQTLTKETWFHPAELRLAFDSDSGQLAGFTWVKTTGDTAAHETELYVLGVDPAYSGIGLGTALFGETLRVMAKRHPRNISLYVDGDNHAARRIYEGAGFTIDQRSTQYLRAALPDTATASSATEAASPG